MGRASGGGAHNGGAGVLVIEGEAGSGKSVLVSEALRLAEASGALRAVFRTDSEGDEGQGREAYPLASSSVTRSPAAVPDSVSKAESRRESVASGETLNVYPASRLRPSYGYTSVRVERGGADGPPPPPLPDVREIDGGSGARDRSPAVEAALNSIRRVSTYITRRAPRFPPGPGSSPRAAPSPSRLTPRRVARSRSSFAAWEDFDLAPEREPDRDPLAAAGGAPRPSAVVAMLPTSFARLGGVGEGGAGGAEEGRGYSPPGPADVGAGLASLRDSLARLDPELASPANARLLHDLLEDAPAVAGARARAHGGGRGDDGHRDSAADALLLFLSSLLRTLMRRLGAILVVEDASFLDSPTQRLVKTVAQHSEASVIITLRTGGEEGEGDFMAKASPIASGDLAAARDRGREREGSEPGPLSGPRKPPSFSVLSLPAASASRAKKVAMGPLDVKEARRFMGHLTEIPPLGVPAWLAEELRERARGNPFLLQEMPAPAFLTRRRSPQTALLLAKGVIARSPDWRRLLAFDERGRELGPSERRSNLPVPVSLERVLVSRLDRLSPDAALVCKLCSVLGARFEQGSVLSVLAPEVNPATLLSCLRSLERHGVLLRGKSFRGSPEYRFAQASLCDIVYQLLSESDRRRLHWRAALDLEARPGSPAAALAQHCGRAGALAAAVHYLDRAAAEAMAAGAYAEVRPRPAPLRPAIS
eukprot:tig00021179_g19298.t1